MARIPEPDIERLKQEVSLQRLVEAQGIALTQAGVRPAIATPLRAIYSASAAP